VTLLWTQGQLALEAQYLSEVSLLADTLYLVKNLIQSSERFFYPAELGGGCLLRGVRLNTAAACAIRPSMILRREDKVPSVASSFSRMRRLL
jgi:hypothetical protein